MPASTGVYLLVGGGSPLKLRIAAVAIALLSPILPPAEAHEVCLTQDVCAESIHSAEGGECSTESEGSYERGAQARILVTDIEIIEYCRSTSEGSVRGTMVHLGRGDVMGDPDSGVKWEACEGYWWCDRPCIHRVWVTTLTFGHQHTADCVNGQGPVVVIPLLP